MMHFLYLVKKNMIDFFTACTEYNSIEQKLAHMYLTKIFRWSIVLLIGRTKIKSKISNKKDSYLTFRNCKETKSSEQNF